MKLLLLLRTTNLAERVSHADKLLRIFRSIFTKKNTGQVFIYLLENGACTSYLLQVHLGISESSSYECLKHLKTLNLVHPVRRIPKHRNSKGGPRPQVWALVDAHKNDVARAIRIHYRAQSPKYRVAEKLAITILTDYLPKRGTDEIGYSELFQIVKDQNLPYFPKDIALIAADCLKEEGVKVWM